MRLKKREGGRDVGVCWLCAVCRIMEGRVPGACIRLRAPGARWYRWSQVSQNVRTVGQATGTRARKARKELSPKD